MVPGPRPLASQPCTLVLPIAAAPCKQSRMRIQGIVPGPWLSCWSTEHPCPANQSCRLNSLRCGTSSSFQTLASRGCFLWEPKPTFAKVRKSCPCLQNLRRCRPACSTEWLRCCSLVQPPPTFLKHIQFMPVTPCESSQKPAQLAILACRACCLGFCSERQG